ncbi:carbohydrate ABC transporter permease [Pseudanabaena sp. PCC 6802]|uniref:carbohydrate ABC transporter permease n=1 Tax=Pseudanabaena sp. PCC 6802 TaxID=118173 RepID=UPI00037D9A7E|nr:sugar ABC transporter permease [Pseudanabaena sp. PCC 6802]
MQPLSKPPIKSSQASAKLGNWLDRSAVSAWIFLTPALLLLGIFVLYPILYLGYLSVTGGHLTLGGVRWVGLNNYIRLLLNPEFWQILGNTAYFTLATVIPSVILPLGMATLLDRSFVGKGILRSLYFLPSVVSIVAAGLGWRWLFQPDGAINSFLNWDRPPAWFNDQALAMLVLILLSIWKQLGFNMVVFLAGLQAIPQSRYEAAELDGANGWQKFWHITLPGLRPTTIFVIISTIIFTFRGFEQVYVVTGGGPLNATNILVHYVYEQAFGLFDFGYAAAAAMVLLAIVLGLVYLQLKVWDEK